MNAAFRISARAVMEERARPQILSAVFICLQGGGAEASQTQNDPDYLRYRLCGVVWHIRCTKRTTSVDAPLSNTDEIAYSGLASDSRRQPDLYWREIEQLRAASIAMRLFRNRMSRRVRAIELVKAIAGNGAIAAWAVFKDHPFVWSGIIGAAQFLDAIKGVFPFTVTHTHASNLTAALELLLVDAQDQWEKIYAGQLTVSEINTALSRLRRLKVEAEHKHFPDGFELPGRIIELATAEARAYFTNTYPQELNT